LATSSSGVMFEWLPNLLVPPSSFLTEQKVCWFLHSMILIDRRNKNLTPEHFCVRLFSRFTESFQALLQCSRHALFKELQFLRPFNCIVLMTFNVVKGCHMSPN
jgi:hypothetical protein